MVVRILVARQSERGNDQAIVLLYSHYYYRNRQFYALLQKIVVLTPVNALILNWVI